MSDDDDLDPLPPLTSEERLEICRRSIADGNRLVRLLRTGSAPQLTVQLYLTQFNELLFDIHCNEAEALRDTASPMAEAEAHLWHLVRQLKPLVPKDASVPDMDSWISLYQTWSDELQRWETLRTQFGSPTCEPEVLRYWEQVGRPMRAVTFTSKSEAELRAEGWIP